jgi:hypothetical protein
MKRGVVNSSVGQKAFSDIGSNLNDTMSKYFDQDLATTGSLLNQRQQNLYMPMQNAAYAQDTASSLPLKYFSTATGMNQPNLSTWQSMMQSRVAQNQQDGGKGGGFFGGLVNGLGSLAAKKIGVG